MLVGKSLSIEYSLKTTHTSYTGLLRTCNNAEVKDKSSCFPTVPEKIWLAFPSEALAALECLACWLPGVGFGPSPTM